MNVKFGIYFCTQDNQRFFGEGPYQLLCGIQQLGSLRDAAKKLGMSYTKAFALIKRAEEGFGFPLTQRQIGGKGGGGSLLTPQAKELLMRYGAYKAACDQMAENLYNTHFSTFRSEKPAADGQ